MGNKYTKLLIVFVFLFAIPLIVAQPSYERSTNLTLSVPCVVEGEYCSSGTTCEATIINPVQTLILNNVSMTQVDSVFQVNLTANQTSVLGEYEFNVACCDGPFCESKALSFLITPSGGPPISSGQGNIILGVMALLLILSVGLFVVGVSSKNIVMRTGGIAFGGIMFLTLVLYTLLVLNETIATSPKLVEGFETFYFVLKMGGTVGILALMVLLFLVFFKAWKIRRGLIDR